MAEYDPTLVSEPPGAMTLGAALNGGAPTTPPMTAGGPQPAAAPKQFGSAWWHYPLALIPGFAQGYMGAQQQLQRMQIDREQLAALQEQRARQAQVQDFATLGEILKAPTPEYRDILFQHWAKGKSPEGKLSPEMETYRQLFKKSDDATVAMLQSVFPEIEAGIKDGSIPREVVQTLMRDPIRGFAALQKIAEDRARKADLAELQGAVTGPQAAPAPAPMPEGSAEMPTQPAAPLSPLEDLQRRRAGLTRVIPRLGTEQAVKNAQALAESLDKQIDRLSGVTGGFNETIEGPDGQEIKIRYNALGEPVNVLGKARSQWELTDVGGKKVMVEKGPQGRVVEVGPSAKTAGGTLEERVAEARVAYRENPTPETKRALDVADQALRVSTDLAKARAININMGQPMSAAQIKDVSEMEGKVQSIDDLLTQIDEKPDLKKVVGPGTPWMRRKFGEFVGEPVQLWGTKFGVTAEQREFLAGLATVSGELRRFQAGLTQTAYEIAKTAPSLPDEGDPMEGVVAKLRAYRGWLVRNRKALQGVLEGSGVRAPGMNVPPAPAPKAQPKPSTFNYGGKEITVTPR